MRASSMRLNIPVQVIAVNDAMTEREIMTLAASDSRLMALHVRELPAGGRAKTMRCELASA